MLKVLLVEDDQRTAQLLVEYLGRHGIETVHVDDGLKALELAAAPDLDAIVLDLMLPGLDGLGVCRAVRRDSDTPVIVVTALGDEADRVTGLELGADDYMVKPISARELVARIRALHRRATGVRRHKEDGAMGLVLNSAKMRATFAGRDLQLTPYEFRLLHTLVLAPGRVLSRDALMESAKGASDEAFDRSVDVQISRIRKKLGAEGRELIRTVRGTGYAFTGSD